MSHKGTIQWNLAHSQCCTTISLSSSQITVFLIIQENFFHLPQNLKEKQNLIFCCQAKRFSSLFSTYFSFIISASTYSNQHLQFYFTI